jgi:plastocyanin
MKLKIVTAAIAILLIVGGIVYLNSSRAKNTDTIPAAFGGDELVVLQQDARTSVKIERAILSKDGYVVVRGGDGRRIGQVIEISRYLEAGEHKNVTIELGDFYTYDEADQLIVMIFHDDSDKSFNDLDQPVNTSAVFAETGKSVLASVFEHEVAPIDGTGMVTVRYTNTGFEPAKLTVPVGTMVEFINQSDEEMWVASNVHPSHEILATFDQFKGAGKGQSYMYTFDKKGVWPYHDHINAALEGVITVE